MAIIDIVLTIAIDKSNSTWYDVLFKIADYLRWRTGTLKEETKMKILVVDDSPRNQQAAREQLGDAHELTIVADYRKAASALEWAERGTFDAVLTDMEIPERAEGGMAHGSGGGATVHWNTADINSFGFAIALMAVRCGVKRVAMLTSTHHHHGAMASAVFALRGPAFEIDGARVVFEADSLTKMRGENPETLDQFVKNWASALAYLMR